MARTAGPAKKSGGKRSVKKEQENIRTSQYSSSEKTITKFSSRTLSVKPPVITQQKKPSIKSRPRKNYALEEIEFYQKTIGFIVPKACMVRLLRYISNNMLKNLPLSGLRFTSNSISILQEATENYLVCLLELSYMVARHAKRVTLFPSDIRLVHRIKNHSI